MHGLQSTLGGTSQAPQAIVVEYNGEVLLDHPEVERQPNEDTAGTGRGAQLRGKLDLIHHYSDYLSEDALREACQTLDSLLELLRPKRNRLC